jgi:hypothetical protein
MSENLIPIAVSSELDVTGEERIHAANRAILTRPVYVPTPIVPSTVTWDPLQKNSLIALSNGNLTATGPSSNVNCLVYATASHNSGKRYFEIIFNNATATSSPFPPHVGLMLMQVDKFGFVGGDTNGWGLRRTGARDHFPTLNEAYMTPTAEGATFQIAVDLDTGKMWVGRDDVWEGDPVAGTDPVFTGITGNVFPVATLSKPVGQPTNVVTAIFRYDWWGYTPPTGYGQWD